MTVNVQHTYHPNTFGLLYGKTTKTACGKRVQTGTLVEPLQTTCKGCQDVQLAHMHEQQSMHDAATKAAKEQGYASVSDWAADHRAENPGEADPAQVQEGKRMSDKFTAIVIAGAPGYAARGHVSHEEAIEQARQHYKRQLTEAELALTAIRRGRVSVFHQIGIWRPKNRKEVK